MIVSNYLKFLMAGLIIVEDFFCSAGGQTIKHIKFLDCPIDNYRSMDTLHKDTLKNMYAYYLINKTKIQSVNFQEIESFLNTDSFIQNEINKKYAELSLTFYLESDNTRALVKSDSTKYLSFCNDDIVVEYVWSYGSPSDTLHYDNGVIKGSEEIILKEPGNP